MYQISLFDLVIHKLLRVGDVIEAKVLGVKPDGKLDLTMREKAYIQMDADAVKLMELIDSYAGVLPFTEKASPEVIKRETGLSKAAFKRAVGRLYKERKIILVRRLVSLRRELSSRSNDSLLGSKEQRKVINVAVRSD